MYVKKADVRGGLKAPSRYLPRCGGTSAPVSVPASGTRLRPLPTALAVSNEATSPPPAATRPTPAKGTPTMTPINPIPTKAPILPEVLFAWSYRSQLK